ncbi:hypothetical protein HDV00_002798, partial [Rhizophlyctis rosea]
WAATGGHIEIVKLLLKAGADVHAKDDATIIWAAAERHSEMVNLLVEVGVDVSRTGKSAGALTAAACNGHVEVVRFLMDSDARDLLSIHPVRLILFVIPIYRVTLLLKIIKNPLKPMYTWEAKVIFTNDDLIHDSIPKHVVIPFYRFCKCPPKRGNDSPDAPDTVEKILHVQQRGFGAVKDGVDDDWMPQPIWKSGGSDEKAVRS